MPVSESQLQEQVADYLRIQYPDVLFHSDFGSGVKLTPGQAMKQKRQNGGRRAWPDMFIAQAAPRLYITHAPTQCGIHLNCADPNSGRLAYYGLFIELKREGERLYPGPRAKKRYKSKDGKEYRFEHFMGRLTAFMICVSMATAPSLPSDLMRQRE